MLFNFAWLVKCQKVELTKNSAASRSTSQNSNLSGDEIQTLHLGASRLEDNLHQTLKKAEEKERIHSNFLTLLEDFEKVFFLICRNL